MSDLEIQWEAREDAMYGYWDNLDAQERFNWLEAYGLGKKHLYKPLEEIFGLLDYLDMTSLSDEIFNEITTEL